MKIINNKVYVCVRAKRVKNKINLCVNSAIDM